MSSRDTTHACTILCHSLELLYLTYDDLINCTDPEHAYLLTCLLIYLFNYLLTFLLTYLLTYLPNYLIT